jgi:hypothetical protein
MAALASAPILKRDIPLQPKQMRLLHLVEQVGPKVPTVIGFGGSRGAAKSGGVRRIALRLAMRQSGIIIWIIRRFWDDLNKDHVKPLFNEFPELQAYWHAGDKELRIPVAGGTSSIFFIHAGLGGRAKRKARGPQAHYIFLEQAEEFTQEEMEQLAGSNRAPGVPEGFCKRIYTYNPGGVGTMYLRRIFLLKDYKDNENPQDFHFIQAYGWDNYEWFRGLGTVTEDEFYYKWTAQKRFDMFTTQTDFGKKLNSLPSSQRIGELMGSFEKFAGQYYSDVWEESKLVLSPMLAGRIIQPWWRRWLATDWGFSHYASTIWFTSGLMSPEAVKSAFGVEMATPLRIIIAYREAVCNDVPEPDLARLLVSMTPPGERKECRDHWLSPDAWAKKGSANTVAEQMEPILITGGLPRLIKADWERVGGWRLLYNCWAVARRLRSWLPEHGPFVHAPEDQPALFISANCPEIIGAVPMMMCREDDPKDIQDMPGKAESDVMDSLRYGVKSYLDAEPNQPAEITREETFAKYEEPTARAMAMLRLAAKEEQGQYIRRRRRG